MAACEHEDFVANVEVNRITDGEGGPVYAFNADVTIRCTGCGEPMVFVGAPIGWPSNRPGMSPDGTELRVPLRPQSADPHFGLGLPGFMARVAEASPGSSN